MKKKGRYILRLDDEAHLTTVVRRRVALWHVVLFLILAIALTVTLAVGVIMLTPLKSLLPGYMPPQERAATVDDLMKVDSLKNLYDRNEAYMANLRTVLNSDRTRGDSVRYATMAVTQTVDTLLPASKAELEFRQMMERKERFNLSVLAPLAADAMIFEDPAPGYAFRSGDEEERIPTLIIPGSRMVHTLTDGIVTDIHYDPAEGYAVSVQHANGFLSRFRRLGAPLVSEGEELSAGQVLAPLAKGTGRNAHLIYLEMWRNGKRLIPYHILRGVAPNTSATHD